jgi:hydroxyacylglutathione hydrolase
MMHLYSFVFGPLSENTFVLYDETNECVIIDPGCSDEQEEKEISDYLSSKKLKPTRLLNTHTHLDHILGNKFIADRYKLLPEYHIYEEIVIRNAPQFAENFGIKYNLSPLAAHYLPEKGVLRFGNSELKMLFTPGHSPGHIAFYSEASKILIAGDTLFKGSIGRTDIPFGNSDQLLESIQNELCVLPDETKVYPGHGLSTDIGHEKDHNPFL